MKITLDMSKAAYSIAKEVYFGHLSILEGRINISRNTGMNESSAQIFIKIFEAMMDGKGYKRAFNNETNQFLFDSIKNDYGEEYLRKALKAAQLHIDYYSTLNKGNLVGLQQIVDKMTKELEYSTY